MGYGYRVSRRTREMEIRRADRRIAWYDLLIANRSALAEHADNTWPFEYLFASEDAAAVFGLSRSDCEALAGHFESFPDWLGDFVVTSAANAAPSLLVPLAARFGHDDAQGGYTLDGRMAAAADWKTYRASEVRDRSRARRAIESGRAT